MTLTHWHRLAACLFAFARHAEAFAWDEAVDGDLSSLNTAPTPIAFTTGVNVVKGTMGGDAGDGIPVDKHAETGVWAPELIFGHLLTSSNYDKTEEKTVGGKNGYGAKLTNIFSKEFTIDTVDHRAKKRYTQTWTANMSAVGASNTWGRS
jgi:DNA gyrase/topoisomerase IV subunit B